MSIDNPLDGPEYPPSHKKLSYYQVARILAAYERGDNVSKLTRELAVSIQAASHWRGYAGLSEAWIRRVKDLERRTKSAEARLTRKTYELRCATSIIKEFEPSPKRRSLIATAMRARFNVTRYSANRIVGLSPAAGESRFVSKADETLIYVMRRYIDVHPRVGFRSLFSVLLKYKPGTRYRAFQIYKKTLPLERWGDHHAASVGTRPLGILRLKKG